ncbi:hypothetical protein H0H93_005889 [Arthromyces matolae]|nr:hypothetical protein H0H93_005889 [Arthromyces matolae]
MNEQGLDLPIFLDALSWGTDDCTPDRKIQYERGALMVSQELPGILRRWSKPPRQQGSKNKRAEGGSKVLDEFVFERVGQVVDEELESLAPHLQSPAGEDVSAEAFTSMGFEEMSRDATEYAPLSFGLLKKMATQRNTQKDPVKACMPPTKASCYLPKVSGVSAKGFDTLHATGLTMSHKWTTDVVGRISEHCMKEVVAALKHCSWLISDDNLTIPFRVFSQRLDNKSDFGNGTAATVYIKRNTPQLSNRANQDLKLKRAEGMKKPLTELEIVDLANKAYPHIHVHMVHYVLQFLLNSPEFDLPTYSGKKDDLLKPPAPIDQLQSGPDHVTLQYLLGTINIPEASYEDHERLLEEWFGLYKFRAEDKNSYERLDFLVLVFGWFHLEMAFARLLHKQYLGTTRGQGLRYAFELLGRKGLLKPLTQGVFHHDLEEALFHIAEAHIQEDWLTISGAESLAGLRDQSPEKLTEFAERLVLKHASSEALDDMDERVANRQPTDEQKRQLVMFNRTFSITLFCIKQYVRVMLV